MNLFRLFGERKKIGAFVILVIILTIPLTIYLARKSQDIRQRASENQVSPPVGGVQLELWTSEFVSDPTPLNINGGTQQVQIILHAETYNITGVDFTITTNKAILPITNYEPPTSFNSVLTNTIDANGTLHFVATSTDVNVTNSQNVSLGTITVSPTALGTASLAFGSSQITALGTVDALPTNYVNKNFIVALPTTTAAPSPVPPTNAPTPTSIPSVCTDGLVKNCGFEEGNGNPAVNWNRWDNMGYANFLRSQEKVHSGQWALKGPDNDFTRRAGTSIVQRIQIQPNHDYEFSAWVWSDNSSTFIDTGDNNDKDHTILQECEARTTQSNQWKKLTCRFTATSNGNYVNIRLVAYSPNTFYDDIEIRDVTPIPTNTPVPTQIPTNTPIPQPTSIPSTPTSSRLSEDVNGDGCISIDDYNDLLFAFRNNSTPRRPEYRPDIDGQNGVDINDYNLLLREFRNGNHRCS